MRRASCDVAGCSLEMRQPERRAGNAARQPLSSLVCRARLVEAAKRFERAREVGMRAGEAGVEFDRHAIRQHRLLVLAREVVHVAEDGVQHDRERIQADRPLRGDQCFLVSLESGKRARQHVVREGESRVQFDGMAQ